MLDDANTLLILAVILVAGTISGAIAKQFNLPSVTGQILAGVIMGESVLKLMSEERLHSLDALVKFALGLMAVAVGSHLNFKRLRPARRRLFWLLLLEATIIPSLVYFGVVAFTSATWYTAILLAAIAIETAPGTMLAIVKETESKGSFVTTLLAGVALNNLMCIVMFEIARTIARTAIDPEGVFVASDLIAPLFKVVASLLLGFTIGFALSTLR